MKQCTLNITYDELYDLYIVQRLLLTEIANKYNISLYLLRRELDKFLLREKRIELLKHELIGLRIGMLEVVQVLTKAENKRLKVKCRCDCGETKEVFLSTFQLNRVKSCGCILRKILSKNPMWKGYKEIPRRIWTRLENNAKTRNLELNITIEYLWDIFLKQNRRCSLSGVELSFKSPKYIEKNKYYPSVDRIDSRKGYVKENIQWIRKELNIIKGPNTDSFFIELCKQVADYSRLKENNGTIL